MNVLNFYSFHHEGCSITSFNTLIIFILRCLTHHFHLHVVWIRYLANVRVLVQLMEFQLNFMDSVSSAAYQNLYERTGNFTFCCMHWFYEKNKKQCMKCRRVKFYIFGSHGGPCPHL